MREVTIKTRFDIGDIVYGFPDNELHKLVIDRIEIAVTKFSEVTQTKVVYLASTIDSKNNFQHRFQDCQLFSEQEVRSYVNDFFCKDKEK